MSAVFVVVMCAIGIVAFVWAGALIVRRDRTNPNPWPWRR